MRKLEKLALRKIVDPSDILKKKQMGNIWGGSEDLCVWCCTHDAHGNCGAHAGYCINIDNCWTYAETYCTPYTDYGIKIIC